jgi:L-amino acid N-acyltransferase YncA
LLVSSYIQEPHRRKGLSKLFYQTRIDWAKAQGNIKALILELRDDNLPSQKAHQNFGFRFIESIIHAWPDGKVRPSLKFRFDL